MVDAEQYKTATRVVQLANAITNYRNRKMDEFGLTSVQGDAIRAIFHERGITAAELKKKLNLSQSTVAGILMRLEKKGLIEKTAVDGDGRKLSLYPTAMGLKLENVLIQSALDTQGNLTQGMTEQEKAEFNRLLDIARANMDSVLTKGE